MLDHSQLFARLAEGHAARLTIVTPNQRLAQRLPDLMAGYLEHLAKPALVVAYGFDVMPPQTREFLARFDWTECAPPPIEGGAVRRVSFPSAKHELEAAANWARARLEAGAKRI